MSDRLQKAFDALIRCIERDTLRFEGRVYGSPFIPHKDPRHEALLRRYCSEIDDLIGSQFPLRHFLWMGAHVRESMEELCYLDHGAVRGWDVKTEMKVGTSQKYLHSALKTGIYIDPRNFGMTPPMFKGWPLLLLVYVVFRGENVDRALAGTDINTDLLRHFKDLPFEWQKEFLLCKVIKIPSDKSLKEHKKAAQELDDSLRFRTVQFQAYHIILSPKDDGLLETVPPHLVQVIRSNVMQFQREWADRAEEDKIRARAANERKEGLLTLNHELKNSLDESNWQPLQFDLQAQGPTAFQDPEIQKRIMYTLDHLMWPQALTHVIRAASKAGTNSPLRPRWLPQGTTGFDATSAVEDYRRSIGYLARYMIASNRDARSSPVKLIEASEADLIQGSLSRLGRRAEVPRPEHLDIQLLRFPPLLQQGDDGNAPTFTLVSLFAEPFRNAVRYVSQNSSAFDHVFVAVCVRASGDQIEVDIVNPIVSKDSVPCLSSTRLVGDYARWLNIGQITEPTFLVDENQHFVRFTVVFTPHKLGI